MRLTIRKASTHDGLEIYRFLQQIPASENGFINSAAGKTYEEYLQWLEGVVAGSQQQSLADGWKVPQSTYWLYLDDYPIGYGKIRHFLTEKLKQAGGHMGISIHPEYRGKGYGKAFIGLLLEECRELNIAELLFTIKNENQPSIKAVIANGGVLRSITADRHYLTIKL